MCHWEPIECQPVYLLWLASDLWVCPIHSHAPLRLGDFSANLPRLITHGLPYKPIFALVDDHNLACMLLSCTAVMIKKHGMLTLIIHFSHSVPFAFTSLHLCIVIIYNSTMRCQSGTFQEFVLAPVTSEI